MSNLSKMFSHAPLQRTDDNADNQPVTSVNVAGESNQQDATTNGKRESQQQSISIRKSVQSNLGKDSKASGIGTRIREKS